MLLIGSYKIATNMLQFFPVHSEMYPCSLVFAGWMNEFITFLYFGMEGGGRRYS